MNLSCESKRTNIYTYIDGNVQAWPRCFRRNQSENTRRRNKVNGRRIEERHEKYHFDRSPSSSRVGRRMRAPMEKSVSRRFLRIAAITNNAFASSSSTPITKCAIQLATTTRNSQISFFFCLLCTRIDPSRSMCVQLAPRTCNNIISFFGGCSCCSVFTISLQPKISQLEPGIHGARCIYVVSCESFDLFSTRISYSFVRNGWCASRPHIRCHLLNSRAKELKNSVLRFLLSLFGLTLFSCDHFMDK